MVQSKRPSPALVLLMVGLLSGLAVVSWASFLSERPASSSPRMLFAAVLVGAALAGFFAARAAVRTRRSGAVQPLWLRALWVVFGAVLIGSGVMLQPAGLPPVTWQWPVLGASLMLVTGLLAGANWDLVRGRAEGID